jgi:hypothetical protein
MKMLFGNVRGEVGREDILNQKVGNKTYMKLVIMMEGKTHLLPIDYLKKHMIWFHERSYGK